MAATLNVLDYDTYFGITQHILAGDYKSALLLFDDVLKKGFSGQTFMSGLASHFRDLLMCKDPSTLPLLETTGSVLERYKQQSAVCEISTLFSGISLLGALDGGFRTATNQRLHVELGLMKLCGLEQKKSPDVTAPTLPPLIKEGAPALQHAPQQTVAQPVAPQQTPQPSVAPQVPVAQQAVASPNSAAPVQPTATAASAPRKSIFGGGSIAAIMNGTAPQASDDEPTLTYYDPNTESKIAAGMEEFMSELATQFPRLSYALKGMKVSGHTISATVMTDMLREDILRHSPEITTILQHTCGIEGGIVLNIDVTKEKASALPIKTEDKVKYLTKENPELLNLIKELDLNIE